MCDAGETMKHLLIDFTSNTATIDGVRFRVPRAGLAPLALIARDGKRPTKKELQDSSGVLVTSYHRAMSDLRKRLAPHGIVLMAKQGRGYWLAEPVRLEVIERQPVEDDFDEDPLDAEMTQQKLNVERCESFLADLQNAYPDGAPPDATPAHRDGVPLRIAPMPAWGATSPAAAVTGW